MEKIGLLPRFHALLVRIECWAICLPVGLAYGGLAFFWLVSGGWLALLLLWPLGILALCLVNFFRLFKGETSEKLLATIGIVIFIIMAYKSLNQPGLNMPSYFMPWVGGIVAISIVSIHWTILAWANYKLPARHGGQQILKRLPDRI